MEKNIYFTNEEFFNEYYKLIGKEVDRNTYNRTFPLQYLLNEYKDYLKKEQKEKPELKEKYLYMIDKMIDSLYIETLNKNNWYGENSLHIVAKNGWIDIAEKLVSSTVKVNYSQQ